MKKEVVYFVSDMHFGIPNYYASLKREKLFVQWLERISQDATQLFIMGDMFDFWFEWKHVVPKGYIRLLGKLAEIADKGISIHIFIGNHDMWLFDYFEKELHAKIHRKNEISKIENSFLYLSHGDGLGPGDLSYKFIKNLFRNSIAQWLYARLHPNFSTGLANYFSKRSRRANTKKTEANKLYEIKLTDAQIEHAKKILEQQHIDYFIFGHQHTPRQVEINEKTTLFNIGNWFHDFSYLRFANDKIEACTFKNKN